MDKILETLEEELEEYRRIFDVAVGTGRFAKPLQDVGFEVVGLDISERMLKKAHEKGTQDLVVGDACILPFQDSTFDASISIATLHLIKDWKSALKEIMRVTKDSLFTVLQEDFDSETSPFSVYSEILQKHGYSYSHPGSGLGKMKEKIKPTKSRFITSCRFSTNRSIAFLSEKAYSFQWKTPADLHEKAIEELKKIFAEKKAYSCDIYLYKWKASDIHSRLESPSTP